MKPSRAVTRFFPEVTNTKDAKRPIQIEVTKGDVSVSKRRAHSGCAMAVACKRKLKVDGVIIARSTAYLIKGKTAIRFGVPGSLEREVTSFDRGSNFEPGVYQLSKPGKRVGGGGGKAPTGKRHGPGQFRHITSHIREVLGGKDVQV